MKFYLFLSTSLILSCSPLIYKNYPTKIHNWKIKTLSVENDTIFNNGDRLLTAKAINKGFIGSEKKEDSDFKYIDRCINSVFNDISAVRLRFKKDTYSHSMLHTCLDNIYIKSTEQGEYTFVNDTLFLNDNNIYLIYDEKLKHLTYRNIKYHYQIIYEEAKDE